MPRIRLSHAHGGRSGIGATIALRPWSQARRLLFALAVLGLPAVAQPQEDLPTRQDAAPLHPAEEQSRESLGAPPAVDAPSPSQPAEVAPAPFANTTPEPGPVSAAAPASPPTPEVVKPSLHIIGHLEPLLSFRDRRMVVGGESGELLLSKRAQATGYLYLAAEAAELGRSFGVKRLSLHLNGWVASELGEVALDRRLTGDLTYGYLRYQRDGLDVRLGRQLILDTGSIPVQLDGGYASADLPLGFGVQAFAGLSVLPRFGGNPRFYLLGDRIDDLVKADVLTTLDRDEKIRSRDFWTAGGRVSHRFRDLSDVGVSFLEERESSYVSRRQIGFDASVRPHRVVDAVFAAVVDTTSWKPRELRLRADLYPLSGLQVSPGYAFSDPTLYLSRYSIFSVFANEANHDAGFDASYSLIRRIRLGAGYHHQVLVGSEGSTEEYEGDGLRQGDVASVRADLILGPQDQLHTGVEYRFLSRPDNGFHSIRGYGAYALTPKLSTALDVSLYFYQKEIPRFYSAAGDGGSHSVDASLSVTYGWQRWRFIGSGGVSANPLMQTSFFTLARAEYLLDFGASSQVGGRP